MRRLLYVSMVHNPWSEYDEIQLMNTLGRDPDEGLSRLFKEGLSDYWDMVDRYLNAHKVQKVYQDSCNDFFSLEHYLKAYREDADNSRNFRAICSLLDQGAQLMHTESNDAKNEAYFEDDPEKKLAIRDRYIAANIEWTLQEGEIGVLFMGFKHKVDIIVEKLYPSITLERIHGSEELMRLYDIAETLRVQYQGGKNPIIIHGE